ncbi:MAG: SusF/SusE family outer membrane protein [Prevotella sp.]|nr:SusF/SusE family outer membrane protein [Prevotella sp.]
MKKLSIYCAALLTLALASCSDEDYFVSGTQAVEQESVLNVADVTVSPLMTTTIDINELLDANAEDSVYIPLGVVSVREGALVDGVQLQSKIQVSANSDYSNPMTFDGESMEGNDTIKLSPKALQEAYYNNVTHSPKSKTLYVRSMVQTVTNGTSVAYVGDPNYYTTGSVTFTPLDMHIVIESEYYYLGSLATDKTYKFTNSGADPYDDPIFSVTVPALGNGWHWFKIAPASAYGEDGNIDWGKEETCICPLANDETARDGKCKNGKNSWHLLEDDGARAYTITVNVMDMTYEITAIPNAAVFDTDPVLYLTGSNYNWGATTDDWKPLVPVHSHSTVSWLIIYLHQGEEFKFAPQQGWGNDFGMSATVIDNAGMNPSGDNNIVVGNSGWYLIKVDNTDGARTVEFLKPNIYLIGNTAAAGWNVDDSGLFTVPESEDGEFVSPAFAASDEVRMCVKLNDIDWWQTEFIITSDGVIDYRGAGNDQSRVKVTEGQKCYINFGTASGSYK